MANPQVCGGVRDLDGAKCVVAPHPDRPDLHAFIREIDKRLYLLDDLAETFKRNGEWAAYHHVRAVAHDLGFHLSGCTTGLKVLATSKVKR